MRYVPDEVELDPEAIDQEAQDILEASFGEIAAQLIQNPRLAYSQGIADRLLAFTIQAKEQAVENVRESTIANIQNDYVERDEHEDCVVCG